MKKRFHIFAKPIATATGAPPEESFIRTVETDERPEDLEARLNSSRFGAVEFRLIAAR